MSRVGPANLSVAEHHCHPEIASPHVLRPVSATQRDCQTRNHGTFGLFASSSVTVVKASPRQLPLVRLERCHSRGAAARWA
jgi:hypothetical protein